MSIKVIGAGFGRTGTLSLKHGLEMLGFDKCYHMMEVHLNPTHAQIWKDLADGIEPDWHQLFEGYQASVDWPSCNFWRQQMVAFPEAKVILTRRDPEKWYTSIMNTIWPSSKASAASEDPAAKLRSSMVFSVIWDGIFAGRMDDKDFVISQFEKHNQQVIGEVPAEKLLVYEPGDGWEPLCEFLQVPVPEAEYPRVNSTEDFRAQWDKIAKQAKEKRST
jgi:sulfotransferase family protein